MHNILRTRFRVIDHAEFVLIIVSRKEETILLDKQTKAFSKAYFISKRVENCGTASVKKKTYTIEGDVEFLQDKDSYDDISSEFTESDVISDIYSVDITEEQVLS